jgi:hypothetical protein
MTTPNSFSPPKFSSALVPSDDGFVSLRQSVAGGTHQSVGRETPESLASQRSRAVAGFLRDFFVVRF